MLQRDTEHPLSSRQSKMVDEAEKSCARLTTVIAELSDIAKLDAGLIQTVRGLGYSLEDPKLGGTAAEA